MIIRFDMIILILLLRLLPIFYVISSSLYNNISCAVLIQFRTAFGAPIL